MGTSEEGYRHREGNRRNQRVKRAQGGEEQHRRLQRQIYDYDGFCEEQEFYKRVEAILDSDEIISNPIMRLADKEYMETLSPVDRQTYVTKIAAKYRQAVERYRQLRS